MMVTAARVRALSINARSEIAEGIQAHSHLLAVHGIDTPLRAAHFLAQLAHESDGFRTTREYHDGSNYEGRRDLGNIQEGDGVRYRGRGLIQLTGRDNYRRAGEALGRNLVGHPEQVEAFPTALEVSCWFWAANGLNKHADNDDVRAVSRAINGGFNGLKDRKRRLKIAKRIWVDGDAPPMTLRRGDEGEDVRVLQATIGVEPVDGIFGPATEEAVKAWQARHELEPDGVVGPLTWQAIDDDSPPAPEPQIDPGPDPAQTGFFITLIRKVISWLTTAK